MNIDTSPSAQTLRGNVAPVEEGGGGVEACADTASRAASSGRLFVLRSRA